MKLIQYCDMNYKEFLALHYSTNNAIFLEMEQTIHSCHVPMKQGPHIFSKMVKIIFFFPNFDKQNFQFWYKSELLIA